jgi:SAM-dependent methyltransferase
MLPMRSMLRQYKKRFNFRDITLFMKTSKDVDKAHATALQKLSDNALADEGEIGEWARIAKQDPDRAYEIVLAKLGHLPVNEPWSVFASIYNEDTPDSVFYSVAEFTRRIFNSNEIKKSDPIVDVACGTGALSRNLAKIGYGNIYAFDVSQSMLEEADRLNSHLPQIHTFKSSIDDVHLPITTKGMIWCDFSSNFALTENTLKSWLQHLINNLAPDGVLVFDVRTTTGWDVDFFKQKVTTFSTDAFQRIWINLPDYKNKMIVFDIFIRIREPNGQWGEWQREQMQERMWSLLEVIRLVKELHNTRLTDVYDDQFELTRDDVEPGLAYLVLQKRP